jgi:hypothetical protein
MKRLPKTQNKITKPDLYKVSEVCRLISVSHTKFRTLRYWGKFQFVDIGETNRKVLRITRTSYERFLKSLVTKSNQKRR